MSLNKTWRSKLGHRRWHFHYQAIAMTGKHLPELDAAMLAERECPRNFHATENMMRESETQGTHSVSQLLFAQFAQPLMAMKQAI